MKQHISWDQFNQLDLKQQDTWKQHCDKNGYCVVEKMDGMKVLTFDLPNIGQMIEFIFEHTCRDKFDNINFDGGWNVGKFHEVEGGGEDVWGGYCDSMVYQNGNSFLELCDALWETVKRLL